jgi:hypothetical protein
LDITPTPEIPFRFGILSPALMEAVRQVLGIDDLIPGPDVVIPALQSAETGPKIEAAHRTIASSRAAGVADECAAEMKQKLDDGETAEKMGFGPMSAAELIASEWKCWFDEESHIDLKEEEYRLEELKEMP